MYSKIKKWLKKKLLALVEVLKDFKEEIFTIPFLIIGVYMYKAYMSLRFPNDHQLSIPSQTDYMFTDAVKLIVSTMIAWLAIRISFPKAYQYLKYEFYQFSDEMSEEEKRKYSLLIFFAFLFAFILIN